MTLSALAWALAAGSGALVGGSLGLIGGGGSVLAVPLLVYLVGLQPPHLAIGTSAVAVAANALIGLLGHARRGNVDWRRGLGFAASGVAGTWAGTALGQRIDGQALLAAFALLMVLVAVLMLRRKETTAATPAAAAPWKLVAAGLGTGTLAGFFGIGGGFLIVPGLVLATEMPMLRAIGTSLLSVAAFGATTATSYALAGLVNWPIALTFIAGGALGTVAGGTAARRLSQQRGALTRIFATLVLVVAAYMLWRSAAAW